MDIKITKADLLVALEAKRPTAEQIDADRLSKHKAEVKAAAAARRVQLRELIKLDDKTLGEMTSYNFRQLVIKGEGVSCPDSVASKLNRAISTLRYDARKTITLRPNDSLLWLLNLGDAQAERVC